MEVALGGGALAEEAHRHLVLAAELGRVGEAGGVGELGGDRRRAGDDVARRPAPVVRHLPAAAVRVVGAGEHGEQDLLDGHAEREHHAGVAVVGQHDVVAGAQRPRRADLGALVALARHDEGGLAHPVEAPDLLVEHPRGEDGAVHAHQVVGGEAELGVAIVEVQHRQVVGGGHGATGAAGHRLRSVTAPGWSRSASLARTSMSVIVWLPRSVVSRAPRSRSSVPRRSGAPPAGRRPPRW